jgi:hypothetical protein
MEIPGALSERFPILDALEEDWGPVPRAAFLGWLAFYTLRIGNALLGGHLFPWFDLAFIPIQEGGHLPFRFFGGEWMMVAGGTLLQLFVPVALAVNIAFRRPGLGTAFCAFFFFEPLLPISVYRVGARAQEPPLLTGGDSDDVIPDWFGLFSHAGLLQHDTQIAAAFRILGWIGMFAAVV